MRLYFCSACLFACLALSAAFADDLTVPSLSVAPPSRSVSSADVTVILNFKSFWSLQTIREMEREASQIIAASGLKLDWRERSESADTSFNDLVVMTFRGSCTFVPAPPVYDELGPYASTRTANGEVQPFGDVDCDRVVNSVRSAMFGGDFARGDILVGRALGRVVAHELVHMLTKSEAHGKEGVQKASLSGKQLIAASLPLSEFDVDRLRLGRKLHRLN
jgi:hypothetical protein